MTGLYIFDVSALNKKQNPQIAIMLEQIQSTGSQIAVILEDEKDWEQIATGFLPNHIIARKDYQFTYFRAALGEIIRRASQEDNLFSINFVSADSSHLAEALTVADVHPLSVEEFISAFNIFEEY